MNEFRDLLAQYPPEEVDKALASITPERVEQALAKTERDLEDFLALISSAAAPYLEKMAQKSRQLTLQRFGNNMQLFAPLYLSNECQNICTYCGFSLDNKIPRKTLSDQEIMKEVEVLKGLGFEHILLVTGEANRTVGVDYLEHAIQLIKPHFANVSMEVQPLDQHEYERLISSGLHSVLVYQETYYRDTYKIHHPKGKKSNFDYRLETPDRLGKAGIHKIGIGSLIGLEDWRVDSFYTAMHLRYLEKKYWQTKYAISFPRLRPFSGGQEPKVAMNDRELVQLICAYRLLDPDVELSLSTRESEHFRNHVIKLGITSMSAGSKTNPGGYAAGEESLEQFEISDERSPANIAALLERNGYQPVWKDWDPALQSTFG
ncbi:2-iminoacetate synthase ThiH [Echinicola vietnamensis]|uniref:Thiazole biosynthesis protein ThiH n=1 Tax=Echinicola vietnamensis (strain DSM 17526 / LMG 23754 / KMM 6221) TaxID=926556 RepID=L0G0Q5_ECHVK|nr:2-iminoacetate synthase ThiH [Echinicola vietnamensis]AGA79779.1 thiazole biosynthesis protein ThiH [Echinicola vietnamensis DSM 17526]